MEGLKNASQPGASNGRDFPKKLTEISVTGIFENFPYASKNGFLFLLWVGSISWAEKTSWNQLNQVGNTACNSTIGPLHAVDMVYKNRFFIVL